MVHSVHAPFSTLQIMQSVVGRVLRVGSDPGGDAAPRASQGADRYELGVKVLLKTR